MAIQIPFPLPSHGYALNSQMIINLQYLVDQFNSFNSGTATWDSVSIGTGSSITGVLKFFNSSNAFYLAIQPGVTGADVTYTLPITAPSNNSLLLSSGSDVLSWSSVGASSFLYSDGSRVPTWSAITGTSLVTFNSSKVPAYISLSGTANTLLALNGSGTLAQTIPYNVTGASVGLLHTAAGVSVDPLTNSQGTEGFVTVSSVNFPTIKTLLGTTSQVTVTKNTNDWTLSLPQNINTAANVQFGSVVVADGSSSAPGFSFSSQTTLGFTRTASDQITVYGSTGITIAVLTPSQVRIGGNLLVTAAKGLILEGTSFNTTIKAATSPSAAWTLTLPVDGGTNNYVLTTNGSGLTSWAAAGSITGTVNSGTQYQLGYYAATGAAISGLTLITGSRALASDANGLPVAATTTATELGYVNGVTSAIQTQIDGKSPTAGNSSIATVGTVTAGTWSATTIAVNKGGTGQTSYTDGQLLIGNTTGNTLAKATLTGTSNQVVVTNGSGTITLSTPQSIGTGSSPTFVGGTFTGTLDGQGQLKGKGTATNDNAGVGYIGEFASAEITSSTNVGTSNQFFDATSMTLSAGDWMVSGAIMWIANGATMAADVQMTIGISTTSGNDGTGLVQPTTRQADLFIPAGFSQINQVLGPRRVSISTSIVYYLKALTVYSLGTPQYRCVFYAWRMR